RQVALDQGDQVGRFLDAELRVLETVHPGEGEQGGDGRVVERGGVVAVRAGERPRDARVTPVSVPRIEGEEGYSTVHRRAVTGESGRSHCRRADGGGHALR